MADFPQLRGPPARREVLNRATGRWVLATGATGRQILAAHAQALEAQDLTHPLGAFRPRPAVVAAPVARPREYGAYATQVFQTPRAAPALAGFAATIVATAGTVPGLRQITVHYEGRGPRLGETIWRTVHAREYRAIARELQQYGERAPTHGSDQIADDYVLDTRRFTLGWIRLPEGGLKLKLKAVSRKAGEANPFFKLSDLRGNGKPGNCLLDALRACSPVELHERNHTLRARLDLPPAPALIPADPAVLDRLGEVFQLRIAIIGGVQALPDAQRVYSDDPSRGAGRNRCLSEPKALVIAEGGPLMAPLCEIFLSSPGGTIGHYEFISARKEFPRCPVTGDVLSDGKPLTARRMAARCAEQGRTWHGVKAQVVNVPKIYKERVIVYDYETTYDAEGELVPYALGFFELDPASVQVDFVAELSEVRQSYRWALGGDEDDEPRDVTDALFTYIDAAPANVRFTLVSFNGARFDHYLLAAAAARKGRLSDIFAGIGSGLRSLRIGRHLTLDLAKLLPGTSLAAACAAFKTSPAKLAGFEHTIPQAASDAGQLPAWLADNREQVMDYLAHDVLSTASLFSLVRPALKEVTGCECIGPKARQTIASQAWALMSQKCPLPKAVASEALDLTIRKAVVGGRTQVFGPAPAKIEGEPLRMVDFASLYPTCMAAVPKAAAIFDPADHWGFYPSGAENGEPEDVADLTPGDVGIFQITVVRQPVPAVLPLKVDGEAHDWNPVCPFEAYATHLDIALIRERCGADAVQVHRGWRWPVTRPGMFSDFVLPLAAKKDEQDVLRESKSPDYNPALREVYKLLQNAASGKTIERNHEDLTQLARGGMAQLDAENQLQPNTPREYVALGGETILIIGKKKREKVYNPEKAKPSILAVLIYSYARALVWKTLCQHNVLYGDTDSGLFRVGDYLRLRAAFPALDPRGRRKELGDLEEELGEHVTAVAYLLAPKDYAVFLLSIEGAVLPKSKIRVKGVHLDSDRLVLDRPALEALTLQGYTEEYHANATQMSRPIKDDVPGFFRARIEAIQRGETLAVLVSQITRTFRGASGFELRQRFLIKEL